MGTHVCWCTHALVKKAPSPPPLTVTGNSYAPHPCFSELLEFFLRMSFWASAPFPSGPPVAVLDYDPGREIN